MLSHGGKVIPAPYGVQRRMTPEDDRMDQLNNTWIIFQVIQQLFYMLVIMKVLTKKE